MDKFSKVQKVQQGSKAQNSEYIYDGEHIKVRSVNGYEWTESEDSIFVLPYIKDEGVLLMRYEEIPSFQYKYIEKITNCKLVIIKITLMY